MENNILTLSSLPKTWIFDFDGTLVKHNGYKTGEDEWLPGALEFLHSIPIEDYVLILTARFEDFAPKKTKEFLAKYNVRYSEILFKIPVGERILFNDDKPSGLKCAFAIASKRDQGLEHISINISENL